MKNKKEQQIEINSLQGDLKQEINDLNSLIQSINVKISSNFDQMKQSDSDFSKEIQ